MSLRSYIISRHRGASILLKRQLRHKFRSLSKDAFYLLLLYWLTGRQTLSLSPCLIAERELALPSAVILNQKNRASAFWMTCDAELPSWSICTDAAAASGGGGAHGLH